MLGLLGEKLGMTQVYDEEGSLVPVTVVRVAPNVVTGVRTKEKNGYEAVQLGSGETKESRLKKPVAGYFKKNQLKLLSVLREFSVEKSLEFKVGAEIRASVFQAGEGVEVQGESKGKGFQGVMKRWHFAGGHDSHGCSLSHRAPGSIGQRAYPGRVMRGMKMGGHMGADTVTVKNLKIVAVEAEQNLVLVKGALPGANNSRVVIYSQAKDFVRRVLNATKTPDQVVA